MSMGGRISALRDRRAAKERSRQIDRNLRADSGMEERKIKVLIMGKYVIVR